MKKNKKIFSFLDVSLIIILCSLIMCFLGSTLVYKHLGGVNFSVLDNDEGLKEFISAYNNLLDNYYEDLDKQDLINGAITGMYGITGDPYTTYLDDSSSNSLDDTLNGEYQGIGVEIMQTTDGLMKLTKVFDDSPAQKVGLKVGDYITKVGDVEVNANNRTDLIDNIKESEKVTLTILRDNQELTFTLSPSTIMKPALDYQILSKDGKKVGYIKFEVFSDTADTQFTNALNKLEKTGIDSLIIDLRNNSGGYLQVAENIAEIFLEKGKIIYSLQNKDSLTTTKDETSEKRSYNIAVIINGRSASASEILAAALKYSYGATLVGGRSYGKGKVQERSNFSTGASIKYTTAEWLTPEGDCIDGIGLSPDIMMDLITDGVNYDPTNPYSDSQIMAAVDFLVD